MPSTLTLSTGGLFPGLTSSGFAPLLTNGAPITLNPSVPLNANQDPTRPPFQGAGLTPQQLSDLQSISTLRNPNGVTIVPTQTGFTAIADGYQAEFDPNTLVGRISPALQPDLSSGQQNLLGDGTQTYTGTDILIMIESADPAPDGRRYAKQLLEATTITVSIHREVAPVRAGGYINPKGFALGKRTIAGTLIVTQFTLDVFYSFLQSLNLTDGSKDTVFTKMDQLPPFNVTMIFTNELGYASQRKLLGLKFVTDGIVYSIQDMLTEQTLSYMALDFTPLTPLTLDNLYTPQNQLDQTTRRERVPTDGMQQQPPLANASFS